MAEIGRWLGAVVLGLAFGAVMWGLLDLLPWLGPAPLGACLAAGLAPALFLAWIGLPLFADGSWQPTTPRARAYEAFRLRLAQAAAIRQRRGETHAALEIATTGFTLILLGVVGSVFLLGGFWSESAGIHLRIFAFGGAIACGVAAWVWGGRPGRWIGPLLAACAIAVWIGIGIGIGS